MSGFDSILVRVEIGGSRKLRRFTPAERWCVVAGVWALAAKAPLRGYLLIAEGIAVEPADIAEQAGVTPAIARSTLAKLRDLGMLEHDDEHGAEFVHDWHNHQPEPKASETPTEWRERKRRQRARKAESHTDVPRDSHTDVPPLREEKEREGNTPGAREICDCLADSIAGNGLQRPSVTETWLTAAQQLLDKGITPTEACRASAWAQEHEWWRGRITNLPSLARNWDALLLQAGGDIAAEAPTSEWVADLNGRQGLR